jgi:ribose transport system ATP-binding protein
LYKGEVLGISGLVGAGRTELLRLIAGIDRPDTGSISLHGVRLRRPNPRAAIRAGIGLLPEERKRDGIIPERSVVSNLGLPSLPKFSRFGVIRRRLLETETKRLMRELQLKPLAVNRPIATFSGGNQQKIIIGRWLAASADVLLFDEPTRGIDVGAKAEIYSVLETLAAEGKAIIVVSSEMQELIRVADRVLVMRDGRISATLTDDTITENDMLRWAIPQGSTATLTQSASDT